MIEQVMSNLERSPIVIRLGYDLRTIPTIIRKVVKMYVNRAGQPHGPRARSM